MAGKRRYCFNERFFSEINSEKKAYWLGFIFADGCVCRNDLILSIKDREHLEKFVNDIDGNNKIQTYLKKTNFGKFETHRLSIRSTGFFEDLANYGVTPNKSYTANPILNFLNDLHRHFWRGVLDGDGYISNYKDYYKTKEYSIFELGCCGGLEMMTKFCEFIFRECGEKINIRRDKTIYRWSCVGRKAKKIYTHLYKNSAIYLTRKYEPENFDFTGYS